MSVQNRPVHWLDPEVVREVDLEVERLFKENPPVYDQLCTNPVVDADYVGGLDPIKPQKEKARRALLAREWFRLHGPEDVQPLPVCYEQRERLMGHGILLHHILKWYARSLEGRKFDVMEHPPFADFVRGVLWEWELPVGGFVARLNYPPEQLQELKRRYPPRMLKGMGPGLHWLPPKLHAAEMDRVRESFPDIPCFNRE